MPTSRQVGEQTVWRVFSQLVSYASSDAGLVWVSDRTQAENSGIPRRSVRSARSLLLEAGLMLDTGRVKQKGVKVFQMKIPNYEFAPSLPTEEPFDSGTGRGSGLGSGRGSGRDSGTADLPQTELEKNINIKEHTQKSNINNLSQTELDNAGEYNLIDKTTPEQYAYEANLQVLAEQELAKAREGAMAEVQKMMQGKFTAKDDNEEPF